MLDNTPNETYKLKTKNWVEKSDDACRTYNTNSQIKFKTSMLKSSLCDYSDAFIPVSGTITITRARADDAAKRLDERNEGVIFKNCVLFIDCISKIKNTEIDKAKDLDVMVMYNLIEYNNNCSKTSESLWQYYRDDPNNNIVESESLKFKINITGKTHAVGNTKDVKIAVPLKYL